MYQLLIVDDEIHAVRAVQGGVNWEELSISRIHIAHNMKQAKDIFGEHPIDIMICDIEMPQGSGIELLSWVREKHALTESIFLTCHSNFDYAKEALQLGSLDYMLKPVKYHELRNVVQKGVEKVNEKREQHTSKAEGQYYSMLWQTHRPVLMERFWHDVMDRRQSSHPDRIRDALHNQSLPIKETEAFLPVLVYVQRWAEKLSLRDEKLMEYALRNAADDIIWRGCEHRPFVRMSGDLYVAILPAEYLGDDRERLKGILTDYIAACNRYFRCDISCYVGELGLSHEIATRYDSLIRLKDNVLNRSNDVIFWSEELGSSGAVDIIRMNVWLKMLEQGAYDAILSETEHYLQSLQEVGFLKAEVLQQFLQNFLQMLYHFFQYKEWQAYQVLGEEVSLERMSQAVRSLTDLRIWASTALTRTIAYARQREDNVTVMDKVKSFISQHVSQSISREDIARHVHLHPDYLSRLFKKETGQSIVEYILDEKMAIARELLTGTELSVSDVASSVGYSNFSYFSKVFKSAIQMNPNEYRKAARKAAGRKP
ncbi:response regulator [Paenibacillus sp. 1011MAR3C5]|uniref:helix-turn-helix domain-containing protein n=1 Tax=Paenibacillus sp. 1011MAR3C5 TaxID=1675787 RepID=UPI000E6B759B|nr:helix-turn-helix domain-containing protein [Paenibacillus sp. 1011MAR3C5]RJE86225.1 response regulator [Paenibacillus sp. 1011MAR3C5]